MYAHMHTQTSIHCRSKRPLAVKHEKENKRCNCQLSPLDTWSHGNSIIWKAPLSICHGCGFHVGQKLLPKAGKSPPSLMSFLSPLLSPVAKRSGQCSLLSHFKGCVFFCSSEDFQISLATVPHLLYGLGVHICSWQRCGFVPSPLFFFPSKPDEINKKKKIHASLHLWLQEAIPVLAPSSALVTSQQMVLCLCRLARAQPRAALPEESSPGSSCPSSAALRTNSCYHCTLLGAGEGRQPAVSETLPAPMEEDASRQYWSHNAGCTLRLRAPMCLC